MFFKRANTEQLYRMALKLYKEKYELFSRMELLKLRKEKMLEYSDVYRMLEQEHEPRTDIFGFSIDYEEDDSFDILISKYKGVEWIAEYRAVIELLKKISNYSPNDKILYNGEYVEIRSLPENDNPYQNFCSLSRLNILTSDSTINPDIYNIFKTADEYDDGKCFARMLEPEYKIELDQYPQLPTYLFNYVISEFPINKTVFNDLIDEHALYINFNELNYQGIINLYNNIGKNNFDLAINKLLTNNNNKLSNFYRSLYKEIIEYPYNSLEVLKYVIKHGEKDIYIHAIDIYKLCKNSLMDEAKFLMSKFTKYETFIEYDVYVLEENRKIATCVDDYLWDDDGNFIVKTPLIKMNVYQLIMGDKDISNKLKTFIKDRFEKSPHKKISIKNLTKEEKLPINEKK